MYNRQEAAKMRQEFWITFGRYMKPVISASGTPVNWINYKTGIRHVFFRMHADSDGAAVSVLLQHPDPAARASCYDQWQALKPLLGRLSGLDWEWEPAGSNESGMPVSRIRRQLPGTSLYNREDWPAIISFLKAAITGLDRFWFEVKPAFDTELW